MSETKTIRAIKPIDGQPVGTVLTVLPDIADFLVQGGAAEEVQSVVAKTASNPVEGANVRKSTPLSSQANTRLRGVTEAEFDKQSEEKK